MRPQISKNKNVGLTMLDDIVHSGYAIAMLIPNTCHLPHQPVERCFLIRDLKEFGNSIESSSAYFKTYAPGVVHEVEMLRALKWAMPGHSEPCIQKWYIMEDTVPADNHICCFKPVSDSNTQLAIIDTSPGFVWLDIATKRSDRVPLSQIVEACAKDTSP